MNLKLFFVLLFSSTVINATEPTQESLLCSQKLTGFRYSQFLPSILIKQSDAAARSRYKNSLKKYQGLSDDEAIQLLDKYNIFNSAIFKNQAGEEFFEINEKQFNKLPLGHKLFKEDGSVYLISKKYEKPSFKVGVSKKWVEKQFDFQASTTKDASIIANLGNWKKLKQEPKVASKAIAKLLKGKYLISFDLETSGLSHSNQILEIYAQISKPTVKDGQIHLKKVDSFHKHIAPTPETLYQYYKSKDPSKESSNLSVKEIFEMINYDFTKRNDFLSEELVLTDLQKFLNQYPKSIFMAHNISFDANMINARFLNNDIDFKVPEESLIDTKIIANYFWLPLKKFQALTDKKAAKVIKQLEVEKESKSRGKYTYLSVRLGDLIKAMNNGKQLEAWHQADADVFAMDDIFQKMFKDLSDSDVSEKELIKEKVQKKFPKGLRD